MYVGRGVITAIQSRFARLLYDSCHVFYLRILQQEEVNRIPHRRMLPLRIHPPRRLLSMCEKCAGNAMTEGGYTRMIWSPRLT